MSQTSQPTVPWHRLRAWIDEQEAWEKQHNAPAPLTPAQKAAIQCLIPPPAVQELDFGDQDYVSLLCQYAQAHRHAMPAYDSVSVPDMISPRWRVLCTLPWCNEVLPKEIYGVEKHSEPPSFQNKKKAKQYAAKQALAFLRGSPSEPIAKPTPPTSPPAKKTKTDNESPTSEDEGPGIYEQVAALCSQLGFEVPSYRTTPEDNQPGFWRGQPYFKHDARIPDDLGCVRGMLGKKEAKREMAEQVLVWLLAREQERHELTKQLLGGLDVKE